MNTNIKTFLTNNNIWKSLILIAALLPTVIIYLVECLSIFFRHMPVTFMVHEVLQFVLIVIALVLTAFAIKQQLGHNSSTYLNIINDISKLVIAFTVVMAVFYIVFKYGILFVTIHEVLYLLLSLTTAALGVFILVKCLDAFIIKKYSTEVINISEEKNKKERIKKTVAKVFLIIMIFATGLSQSSAYSLYIVNMLVRFVPAVLSAILFVSLLKNDSNEVTESGEPLLETGKTSRIKIPTCILLAGLLTGYIILPFFDTGYELTKIMLNTVESGRNYAKAYKPNHAIYQYKKARNYRDIMLAFSGEDAKDITRIYETAYTDDYISGIYFSDKDEFIYLENAYQLGDMTASQAFILLDGYSRKEELTEEEQIYQKAVTRYCINHNWLVDVNRIVGIKYLDRKNIEKSCEELKDNLEYIEALENVQIALEYGGPDREAVDRILKAAEQNRDDIVYQLIAMGMHEDVKDSSDKQRIGRATRTYYELVCESGDDEERLLAAKLATEVEINLNEYSEAIRIAKDCRQVITDTDLNIALLRAYTGSSSGHYQELAELAIEMLKTDPDNVEYMDYAAINTWNTKDYMTSIGYTIQMCEAFVKAEGDRRDEIFNFINDMVTRMTYYDSRGQLFVGYIMYEYATENLSDEAVALINTNELLAHMWNAYKLIYNKGDMNVAYSELEKVESLAPDTYMLHFQKGNVYYAMGEFEKALSEYQTCLDAHYDVPMLRAALECNLILGNKDEAIRLCEEILRVNSTAFSDDVSVNDGTRNDEQGLFDNVKRAEELLVELTKEE